MPHLREVAERLSAYGDAPFAELRLYVVDREVHVVEPDPEKGVGVITGQAAIPVVVRDVWDDVRAEAEKLKHRRPEQLDRIERQRFRMHGAPVVAGTRIPVFAIKSLSDDGYNARRIVQEYPDLTPEDVRAALDDDQTLKLTARSLMARRIASGCLFARSSGRSGLTPSRVLPR